MNSYLISILILLNNIWGTILLIKHGTPIIKQLLKMDELNDLNNKIAIEQKRHDLESDSTKRQGITNSLTKLQLRKQILLLKQQKSNL